MKQPPLLQTLSIVMALGLLHLQMQGRLLVDLPSREFVAAAIVLVGAGMMFSPLGRRESPPSRAEDDVDLSA